MQNTVILVTNYGMGKAEEKLQLMLIAKYFELLLQGGDFPSAICFYTDAVKLVCSSTSRIHSELPFNMQSWMAFISCCPKLFPFCINCIWQLEKLLGS